MVRGIDDMEPTAQKSLERVISQRAMQMSSSYPCIIGVVSFICGVCVTHLLLVVSTPFKSSQLGLAYSSSSGKVSQNSSLAHLGIDQTGNCGRLPNDIGKSKNIQGSGDLGEDKVYLLYSAWSTQLEQSKDFKGESSSGGSSLPKAPHLENCRTSTEINIHLDKRGENGSFPPWTMWKGMLGLELLQQTPTNSEKHMPSGYDMKFEGAYPPWIVGSDEDNFPSTRRVQQDLWMHQHPQNCYDSKLRFLIADWERLPGFGIGAQLAGMSGLLAVAINENRILVTNYYNRADHNGCQGLSRSHWSCYFFPETSQECRQRAFDLMRSQEIWDNKIVTMKENYTSEEIWAGRIPRNWGNPWSSLQPTTDIDGSLLMSHRKMDRRWWRAQVLRA